MLIGRRRSPAGGMAMNKTLVCALMALAIPAGAPLALDHPQLKEGLWQTHTQGLDAQGKVTSEGTREICRSHAFDKALEDKVNAVMAKNCTPMVESRSGDTITSESSCKVPSIGITISTKGVTTFSSDTAVHSESHSTYAPALNGTTSDAMIQDSKYLGACPAGMQPGDGKNADGTITHSDVKVK
jgi:hypothetical protein